MNSYERTTCSFVVKMWVEPGAGPAARPWRGRVMIIPSGEEQYFTDLAELSRIIKAHLRFLQAAGATSE